MTEVRYGSQAKAVRHAVLAQIEEVKQEMLHHNDAGSMEVVKNTCKLIGAWKATEHGAYRSTTHDLGRERPKWIKTAMKSK